ncbi:hypothetical protein GOC03_27060 [Sinorhizobium meliloti]|nr:hypothetical protein [Sinorhizobium meliloti]
MAENPKNPPAKKTIEDPPEYVAVPGEATYQQNGQQAAAPSSSNIKGGFGGEREAAPRSYPPVEGPQNGAEAPPSKESGDWLGGPQNGAETPASNDDRGRVPAADVKKAPKGSLSGGVDEQEGGGPDVSARNPQTGEGYARNPQTGE